MEHPHLFVIARAVHVVCVVLWIGGVAFVTTVLIPALRRLPDARQRLELFEALEGRFGWQARATTLLTGLTGFFMLALLEGWDRYRFASFWWMHMMTFIWLVFTALLFYLEPVFLHGWFHKKAEEDSDRAFKILYRAHVVLLILSLIAVAGAVTGSRGYPFF